MLEQQTWVTALAVAGGWFALMGYLRNIRQDLKAELVASRADLKTDTGRLEAQIAASRADLKTDIGRVDGRLVALESRVHDIVTRLPAAVTSAKPTAR